MPHNEGGKAVYKMAPDQLSKKLEEFIIKYKNIKIIGGCCGTTPGHIEELRKILDKH
jgi:5-methyltetrahydrofolate--homocysteine methyltransferase